MYAKPAGITALFFALVSLGAFIFLGVRYAAMPLVVFVLSLLALILAVVGVIKASMEKTAGTLILSVIAGLLALVPLIILLATLGLVLW